jgi:hypothetical protein
MATILKYGRKVAAGLGAVSVGGQTATLAYSTAEDGSADASTGTAQRPNLWTDIADIHYPPPWKLPGKDYRAGPPSTQTYFTIGVDPDPDGWTRNDTFKLLTSTTAGASLDAWDMTVDGGWQVNVNHDGCSVTRCKFKVGARQQAMIIVGGVNGFTGRYNHFDGNKSPSGDFDGAINCYAYGSVTWEYNWIQNAYTDAIQIAAGTGTSTYKHRFNFYDNLGYGTGLRRDGTFARPDHPEDPVHPDACQVFSDTVHDFEDSYNLVLMDDATTHSIDIAGTQVTNAAQNRFFSEGHYSRLRSHHNAMVHSVVPVNGGGVSYVWKVDRSTCATAAEITDNYVLRTGVEYGVFNIEQRGVGPYDFSAVILRNIDMNTGAVLTP